MHTVCLVFVYLYPTTNNINKTGITYGIGNA